MLGIVWDFPSCSLYLLVCYYESRPGPELTELIPSTIPMASKLDIPASSLVSNPTCKQEPLTLVELRKLKLFSLGSQESPLGQPEMR